MDLAEITHRHARFGWMALLVYATLGVVLELFHGFKIGWYLDVGNEVRQLMWRLAHAHGSLLAIINIVFALTLKNLSSTLQPWMERASQSLTGAAIIMPLGFFLGGIKVQGGDPWIGILLVPVGAVLLLIGIASTARGLAR